MSLSFKVYKPVLCIASIAWPATLLPRHYDGKIRSGEVSQHKLYHRLYIPVRRYM